MGSIRRAAGRGASTRGPEWTTGQTSRRRHPRNERNVDTQRAKIGARMHSHLELSSTRTSRRQSCNGQHVIWAEHDRHVGGRVASEHTHDRHTGVHAQHDQARFPKRDAHRRQREACTGCTATLEHAQGPNGVRSGGAHQTEGHTRRCRRARSVYTTSERTCRGMRNRRSSYRALRTQRDVA